MLAEKERDAILQSVMNYQIPEDILELTEYERIFARRNEFLWKWIGVVSREGLTLSCVDEKYLDLVVNLKIPLTMMNTILKYAAEFIRDYYFIDKAYEVVFHKNLSMIKD